MNDTDLRRTSRSGFALPAAIIALVLLSALIAGALFVSTEELRSGRSDIADQRALAVAEAALDRAILSWSAARNTRQVVGTTEIVERSAEGPNDSVVVAVTRVQPNAVWMTAKATTGGDGRPIPARHTVGASLLLVGARVPTRAALSAQGAVSIDAGIVDGRDSTAASSAAALCTRSQPAAGISTSNPSQVACVGCSSETGSGVFGDPPIDSSTIADSSFARFGDETVASIADRATIDIAGGILTPKPSVVDGDCNAADPLNWGDPSGASPCADRYAIIHVRGNATLASGSTGQGILIVDGSIRVEATARFVGVVFASAAIEVTGPGAEIVGAAFARNADRSRASGVSDGGAIRFASCAVRRAILGTARVMRTPVRWWVELR